MQIAEKANNANVIEHEITKTQIKERKIGKTTFIVSTSFSQGKQRDVVSVIARLIENDAEFENEKTAKIV